MGAALGAEIAPAVLLVLILQPMYISDKLKSSIKQEGLEDHVKILENISFLEYLKLVSKAKVFLRTLPHETFRISVVEGVAAGCVPVVPRNGGPWL